MRGSLRAAAIATVFIFSFAVEDLEIKFPPLTLQSSAVFFSGL